jgi:hypothetical protein
MSKNIYRDLTHDFSLPFLQKTTFRPLVLRVLSNKVFVVLLLLSAKANCTPYFQLTFYQRRKSKPNILPKIRPFELQ